MKQDIFQAIADPTRRQILEELANGEKNLNTLASSFDISRPAVSKHVKLLSECGLIKIRKEGRERWCVPQPQALDEVTDWVEKYRTLWQERFDKLASYLDELQTKTNKNK